MQEKKLAQLITSALHLNHGEMEGLLRWSENDSHHLAAGCFGMELQRILVLRVSLWPYLSYHDLGPNFFSE